eukprot:CAMPEP_0119328716 /NCGR_PEP_ID=MMETSP1333-20130426/74066_1 /TAXON_ID=418940 /ORGANISM="Scyphosphaera apsteinii, Strain RCC1455" /LENGTH=119 /DNA_ID=CAMNT_0007337653 /DNA_START=54 /DNA_END=413 /DNA_ORIENTATION=-
MKYYCPIVLGNLLKQQASLMQQYTDINTAEGGDMESMKKAREEKDRLKTEISTLIKSLGPLKWVNKVIMWCADKMPGFSDKIEGCKDMDVDTLISTAMTGNASTYDMKETRKALIQKYK